MSSEWSEENLRFYIPRSKDLVAGLPIELYPFVLFRRVQPNGFEKEDGTVSAKQRPVWGSDHAETFAGLTILYPFLERMKRLDEFSHLLGIDYLEKVLMGYFPRYKWRISLDFSALDSTFGPRWLLSGLSFVQDVMDVNLSFLEQLYHYYSEGSIITPGGTRQGTHGLPSGCTMTNLFETLCLHALTTSYLNELGIQDHKVFQNGDDGLILTNVELDLDHMAAFFKTRGLVLNVSKTMQSQTEARYLQRQFVRSQGDRAVMSTTRMLGRIVYAERGVDVEKVGMSVAQFWILNTISKLENCKRHPYFSEFVNFVKRGDKFGLSPTLVSGKTSTGNEIFRAVSGSPELESGFESMETVRLLTLPDRLQGSQLSRSEKTVTMSDQAAIN